MYKSQPKADMFSHTLHSAHSDPNVLEALVNGEPSRLQPQLQPSGSPNSPIGSSLPPEFLEQGKVSSSDEMVTKYTDAQWDDVFRRTADGLEAYEQGKKKYWDGEHEEVAGTIDHTLLREDAKESEVDALCAEAMREGFAAVCIRPKHVARCASILQSTTIRVVTVIAFPSGTADLFHSIYESRRALDAGAQELDIVLDYTSLKNRSYATVYNHLRILVSQANFPTIFKLILETSQLERRQIIAACTLAKAAGFDSVKTSTGFKGQGATVENVNLMRACCERLADMKLKDGEWNGQRGIMQVKASGGIKTLEDAVKMLEAGASRLGCSAGVSIAREAKGVDGLKTGEGGSRPGY